MLRRRVLVVLAGCALLVPAAAFAQQTVAPPGNSSIDEYLETVPGAGGNHRPGAGGTKLSPHAQKALDALGADGKAAAAATQVTASPKHGGASQSSKRVPLPASEVKVHEPSGSPFSALGHALAGTDDQGGLGAWLPILLAFTAAGFVAVMLMRRRSS